MKATSIIGIGAACFVLLAILTIVLAGHWIEDDLAERSVADLKAVGQDWAKVEMSGRDAVLMGEADADAAQNAMETVSSVWGVRLVQDNTVRPTN